MIRRRRTGPRRFSRSAVKPAFLLLLLVAALLLALILHGRGQPAAAPMELQTSFANGSNQNGQAPPNLCANASSDFPADFSADLSVDSSAGFFSQVSRGGSGGGAAVAALALSRLGDACFQQQAAPGEYMDCSALVQWCYTQLGVSIPRTAADQAKYCADHLLTVPQDQLQCGDLIFWSFTENGRYRNISHTGIYAGNGKIIDASYSRSQVVYRNLYDPEKIVMCGRIPAKKM